MEVKLLISVLVAMVVYTLAYLRDKNRQNLWFRLFRVTVALILVFYWGAGGNFLFFLLGLALISLAQWLLQE